MSIDTKKFLLQVDPMGGIRFHRDQKGHIKATFKLRNKSDYRQAFKVKCSRNDLFKIRPPMGLLDYKQEAVIEVDFKPKDGELPSEERHFFGIYHIPAPEGCTAEGAWSEHYGVAQGECRVKVQFDILKDMYETK